MAKIPFTPSGGVKVDKVSPETSHDLLYCIKNQYNSKRKKDGGDFWTDRHRFAISCGLSEQYFDNVVDDCNSGIPWNPKLCTLIAIAWGLDVSVALLVATIAKDCDYYGFHIAEGFDEMFILTRQEIQDFVRAYTKANGIKQHSEDKIVPILRNANTRDVCINVLIETSCWLEMSWLELQIRAYLYKLTGNINVSGEEIEAIMYGPKKGSTPKPDPKSDDDP